MALPSRDMSARERVAGGLSAAAGVGLCAATGLALAHVSVPPQVSVAPPLRFLGRALVGLGTCGILGSQLAMREAWRVGVDRAACVPLIRHGPYRLVRNPIYTAMVVFMAGNALLLANGVMVVALTLLIAGVELQVRGVEEPFLLDRHGHDYVRWAEKTGRFAPLLGRCGARRRGHRQRIGG